MKKIFSLLLILVAFISINVSAKTVTKAELQNGFVTVMQGLNPQNQVAIDDEKVTLTFTDEDNSASAGETVVIPYSIEEDKVTFDYKNTINNNMSEEDIYSALTVYDIIPTIEYSAVSYIMGNTISDSTAYYDHYSISEEENVYYIQLAVGDDYGDCESDPYCIKYTDFVNNFVFYIDKMYEEKEYTDNLTFVSNDNKDKKNDSTLELSNTLVINTNADFTAVKGADKKWGYVEDEPYTIESESTKKSETTENPQTGINTYVILIGVAIVALTSAVLFRKKVFRRL